MYGNVFSVEDWWVTAEVASHMSRLQHVAQGALTNFIYDISSIGVPYYMKLSPETYRRVTQPSDPCGSCVYDPDRCGECPRLQTWVSQ